MTPEEARGYIDGLSFDSKQDVWGEFPNRYDHWDAFEAFATIAGLRYEYAVQVKRGYWRYDSLFGGWTTRPEHAKWLLDLDEVEGAAEFWGKRYETRVMRRLVSEPEVAE